MLKGEAKKEYQRTYMREYMKQKRNVKTPLRPNVKTSVQPIPGLVMEGKKIVGVQPKSNLNAEPGPNIPLYNPSIHRSGDRVMLRPPHGKKLIEMVIPEIDAEGNAIPAQ